MESGGTPESYGPLQIEATNGARVAVHVAQVQREDGGAATWITKPRKRFWVPALIIVTVLGTALLLMPVCFSRSETRMIHPATGEQASCIAYEIDILSLPFSRWAKELCSNRLRTKGMIPYHEYMQHAPANVRHGEVQNGRGGER